MENEPNAGGNFVRSRLPWVVGVAALVLYFATLNHGISLANLTTVASLSGFNWQAELYFPLYYAVSAPLRLLPQQLVPLGVNLFSALCAALTLALLARAVALLPHDRTSVQRERELSPDALLSVPLAWLPPLLAVLVCGFQMTFWEHATNGTREMLHTLVFAYVVRALLEYRRDDREGWLFKAALAFGMIMASDWSMLAAFPLFLAAVIWMRGLNFFNLRFLGRLSLFGLLGLSLFLLLPTLAVFAKTEGMTFWQALKMNFLGEKDFALSFPRKILVLMSLTSLVPVLVLSIKSAARAADTSQLGVWMAAAIFHVVHALFLVVCLWVMLDPQFSPRLSGFGVPFLSLYFLSALSVGYFSGYFLLVFKPLVVRTRRTSSVALWLHRASTALVIVLAVAATASLLIKNLPTLRVTNPSPLAELARMCVEQLPKRGCVLVDDTRQMLATRAMLAQTGRQKDLMVVEGPSLLLGLPAYERYLRHEYGDQWPSEVVTTSTGQTNGVSRLDLLNRFAKAGELFYLHQSFGAFFEHFYLEPHGLVCKLHPFPTDALIPPPLPAQIVAENEAFWERAGRESLSRILAASPSKTTGAATTLRDQLCLRLHLPADPQPEVRAVAAIYSRALNFLGVSLQRTGDLEKAANHFSLAQTLNPDNVIAQINFEYNKKFRAGQRPPLEKERADANLEGWDRILGQNGPFDEPSICYAEAKVCVAKRFYRQAAQSYERTHFFAPEDVATRLHLGEIDLMVRKTDRALKFSTEILQQPEGLDNTNTNRTDALCLKARAYFVRNEPQQAVALLEAAIQRAPADEYLLASAIIIFSENARFTNALAVVERQLKLQPESQSALMNKGFLDIQVNNFPDAIGAMTQLLTITNRPDALLNRAIAYLRSEQLDPAQKDYEALLKIYPEARQIYFGLGEIAFRRKDTPTAIQRYQSYLSNAVPGAAETRFVENRLKELRGAKSAKP